MGNDSTTHLLGIAILRAVLFVVSALGFGLVLVPFLA